MSAKYPGATFVRVETDSDGVYEAHIAKPDGTAVMVQLDKAFAITGRTRAVVVAGHRHGGEDNDADDTASSSASGT